MKFKIETLLLHDVIRSLNVVTKTNTTDPEGRILIKASGDSISFISNNNSTAISITTDKAVIEEEGSVSILFSKVRNFITSFIPWNGQFGAKEFSFIEKDTKLSIKVDNIFENGKKAKGNLNVECYPTVMITEPDPMNDTSFILSTEIYKMAVSKVIYAVDPGEVRQNIQGMYIYFDKDFVYFTGTDGFMLSEYKAKNSSKIKEGGFIIKHDFIMALRRLISEESQIFFEINNRSIKAKIDNVVISGRLIIGEEFPEYKHLFDNYEYQIKVNKDILMNSLMPFMDILDPEDHKRLTLSIGKKQLTLKNDYAVFSYDDDIEFSGDSFEIDINGSYMKNTVESIKDDILFIKFSNDQGLLIFDSGNFEDQKALITPIKKRSADE